MKDRDAVGGCDSKFMPSNQSTKDDSEMTDIGVPNLQLNKMLNTPVKE